MLRKPIEIPPEIAQAFLADLRAFFKARNQLEEDEIAARQCTALRAYQGPRDKKLRLTDVKQMFVAMKDELP